MTRSTAAWMTAVLMTICEARPALAQVGPDAGAISSPRTTPSMFVPPPSGGGIDVAPPRALAPLIPPEPVSVSGANAAVTVGWTIVPGATGYRVYRLSATSAWQSLVTLGSATYSYKNSGLTNGTTYSYRVTALKGTAESTPSAIVTATALATPTPVTATPGDTQVTLSWGLSAGTTNYTVYRGATYDFATMTQVAVGVATPPYTDTGLTNGTTYYYRVRAVAPYSLSSVSSSASAKPLPPPPATAPASLTAAPGNMQVTLSWAPVAGVTGYKIYRSTTGTFDATVFASTSSTTYKNTGLTNGTTYFYTVAAYGTGGIGPQATPVSAVPTAPPAAPTGLGATAADKVVTLTWNSVADAVSYSLYRGTASKKQATTPIATGLTSLSFTDGPVENGPTYYYQVTARNAGGESVRSAEVAANPEQPQPPVDPARVAAFQFLRQATWGPRPGDIVTLQAQGMDAFIDAQLAAPASIYPDSLLSMSVEATQEHFMSLALNGPDQLRQRMAWALHKIWVASAVEVPSTSGIVTYHRLILNNAFGNYRDLMRDITLHPAMGRYLNMLNNRSQATTGKPPNENFARELMQLFTLGTSVLNADGTPVMTGGAMTPTYTEQDVKELARILTGWTFGDGNPGTVPTRSGSENYGVPMEAVARYHDAGAKTFLGQDFPAGQTAQQDLDQALDAIFDHQNVAPFISRQLIQQLVTSNPSPAYVGAVTSVFSGTGGNLGAVARAILTHPEARVSTLTSGKLSEPVIFVVSILRALNAVVTDHPFMSDKAEAMGQKVMYPPSVFSYFSPGYRVRGTAGANGLPLQGPEFQGLTTVTALERANFVGQLLAGWYGSDVVLDRTEYLNRAGDASALVDFCSRVFMAGRMSAEERAEIIAAVRATSRTNTSERVRTALYLTLTAAQAQIDR